MERRALPICSGQALPAAGAIAIWEPMTRPSPLDDPQVAAHAWARFKRLMRWMFGVTVLVVLVFMALLYSRDEPVSVHFYIATGLGVGFATMLMSALMGLVFLSSGTGHDESVAEDRAQPSAEATDDSGDGRSR
jgi:hypothetical protein